MRIEVDKIASAARHVVTHPRVVVGAQIPAVAGTVTASNSKTTATRQKA